MVIKAKKLKESGIPEKGKLYEISSNREISIEEQQNDGSLDQTILKYDLQNGDVGYCAKEYLPDGLEKDGAKRIDITALMVNHVKKCVRWHLYDMKVNLVGKDIVVKLCNQWDAGLTYLQHNVLCELPGYAQTPDLGVITRDYDRKRMEGLRDQYLHICNEIDSNETRETLSKRKRKPEIAKYRAILKASQEILDGKFHAQNGTGTYDIHIRRLSRKKDNAFHIKLQV